MLESINFMFQISIPFILSFRIKGHQVSVNNRFLGVYLICAYCLISCHEGTQQTGQVTGGQWRVIGTETGAHVDGLVQGCGVSSNVDTTALH